jgi:crossover junction endodeoxyribonuclease RusA
MSTREAQIVLYELPYPPTVNTYWRNLSDRTLISRKGRLYRKEVAAILMMHRARPMLGALVLWIKVYPPDRRKRDLDNILKALLDALQHGGAFENDNQIADLHVSRRSVQPGGAVFVQITPTIDQLEEVLCPQP